MSPISNAAFFDHCPSLVASVSNRFQSSGASVEEIRAPVSYFDGCPAIFRVFLTEAETRTARREL